MDIVKKYEDILSDTLNRVSDDFDKREGSMIFDAVSPVSVEMVHLYIALEYMLKQSFAETADREYLIKIAKSVGVDILPPTTSIILATVDPADLELDNEDRFNVDELNFKVIRKVDEGIYALECETAGQIGNVKDVSFTPIQDIEGFNSLTFKKIERYGEDEESTEHLRNRYFIKVREPATSGNIYHYRRWSLEVNGVGAVKVFPLWNGNGTVKLVIVNNKMEVADAPLINEVKKHIEEVRPIGATVTVVSAKNKSISITANVKTVQGAGLDNITNVFKSKVKDFFKDNVFKTSYVSLAKIGNILLETDNVLDYSELKINGVTANIELEDEEIPLLSDVRFEVR